MVLKIKVKNLEELRKILKSLSLQKVQMFIPDKDEVGKDARSAHVSVYKYIQMFRPEVGQDIGSTYLKLPPGEEEE
jgi:hypothetical protein